jgi:hypothetical protein
MRRNETFEKITKNARPVRVMASLAALLALILRCWHYEEIIQYLLKYVRSIL